MLTAIRRRRFMHHLPCHGKPAAAPNPTNERTIEISRILSHGRNLMKKNVAKKTLRNKRRTITITIKAKLGFQLLEFREDEVKKREKEKINEIGRSCLSIME